ncbi:hypothetical protein E2I00_010769 [Balaenoptera physalus]|uniref:Uncharacterized protein n=1 Tax=Balaenoptera physalus TaxID=9770 RepID=A0A6A1PZ77_BALPH|nr:hypothetical protein E2I00_010769 [Balaenoptera physalus]
MAPAKATLSGKDLSNLSAEGCLLDPQAQGVARLRPRGPGVLCDNDTLGDSRWGSLRNAHLEVKARGFGLARPDRQLALMPTDRETIPSALGDFAVFGPPHLRSSTRGPPPNHPQEASPPHPSLESGAVGSGQAGAICIVMCQTNSAHRRYWRAAPGVCPRAREVLTRGSDWSAPGWGTAGTLACCPGTHRPQERPRGAEKAAGAHTRGREARRGRQQLVQEGLDPERWPQRCGPRPDPVSGGQHPRRLTDSGSPCQRDHRRRARAQCPPPDFQS